jgi:flavin-dependent dehydrogenase
MRRFDVVILGGAFSGASAAILLRREQPELSVLVVERAPAFDMKVGEATTEMSAMFLTRRLAMWNHLEVEQLPKEGLRYWFSNEHVKGHAEASETGGFLRSAVPSFQLRRDALDEHLLATAVAEGATLMRPARVAEVELGDFDSRVTVEQDGVRETVACRWVLDATGRATFLGKRLGLIDRNEEHPTAAVWCRWKNVRHIDDLAARLGGGLAHRGLGSRRLSTNHYMGFGYWIWVIPLGHGETSIGVVYDTRLITIGDGRDRMRDFATFLCAIPALAELLEGAEPRVEDLRFYAFLPYVSRQYMGRGWALLGDAAAFLDPYYSPGLDHAAFSVEGTTEIIKADRAGEPLDARIADHNGAFVRSYHRFFQSVYRDKYYYMGEQDLLSASFLMDTAQYYLFVVIPAYRVYKRFTWMPVLGHPGASLNYRFMRFYNRRFKAIALARRRFGAEGRRNHGRRLKPYFALDWAPVRMTFRGLRLWAVAELDLLRLRLLHPFTRRGSGQGEGSVPSPTLRPARAEPEKAAAE